MHFGYKRNNALGLQYTYYQRITRESFTAYRCSWKAGSLGFGISLPQRRGKFRGFPLLWVQALWLPLPLVWAAPSTWAGVTAKTHPVPGKEASSSSQEWEMGGEGKRCWYCCQWVPETRARALQKHPWTEPEGSLPRLAAGSGRLGGLGHPAK